MGQLFTNNAATNLAGSISDLSTSLTVTPGTGNKFPSIPTAGADYFYLTLSKVVTGVESEFEIVKVTQRTVAAPDTFQIVRAQEGTTAKSYSPGDMASLRITAAPLTAAEAHRNAATDAHDASAISYVNTTSGLAATNTQAAVDEVVAGLGTASTKNTGTAAGEVPLIGATQSATESLAGTARLATQVQAEAGSADDVVMTPLKTKQAIAATAAPSNGEFRSMQIFTTSGTYTKPAGLKRVRVTCVGGGGGGGGGVGGTNLARAGGGGGGGGTSIAIIEQGALSASETVTVGAGGSAGSSTVAGGTGGTSSFGAHAAATGGGGGAFANVSSPTAKAGGGGGAGTGGTLNYAGSPGGWSRTDSDGTNISSGAGGNGGTAALSGGGGAGGITNANGGGGATSGAGGGGGVSNTVTPTNGGAGAGGVVIVEEFF